MTVVAKAGEGDAAAQQSVAAWAASLSKASGRGARAGAPLAGPAARCCRGQADRDGGATAWLYVGAGIGLVRR